MVCAMSSPAEAGTQTVEPGTLRRPGGGASGWEGSRASSGLYTTRRCSTPRRRSSRAHDPGQRAAARLRYVADLQPGRVQLVARAEGRDDGVPPSSAASMRSSLQETRSMQSAT